MHERCPVDPRRTGVKAFEVPGNDPSCWFDGEARWISTPGAMIRVDNGDGTLFGFNVACPGCGQIGTIPVSPKSRVRWDVTGGNVGDVTTLSLAPSILKRCCNWHGFLKSGVFESC